MKTINNQLFDLLRRMESRIPRDQLAQIIISFAYDYGNEQDIFGGFSTELLNIAEEVIAKIPSDIIFDLKNLFDSLSVEHIIDVLKQVVKYNDRFSENSSKNLSELAIKLLRLENNDSLFDLGSGKGGFLSEAYEYVEGNQINLKEFSGAEINHNQIAISQMLLEILLLNNKTRQNIIYSNVLSDTIPIKYNKGYVFPPFGLRFGGSESNFKTIFNGINLSAKNSFELVFIDKLLKNLTGANKRAVALVTGRTLFNATDKEYREALVKSGLLEGIIELPEGILVNSNVKTFLLIFSKGNETVKLIDASMIQVEKNKAYDEPSFDVETILSLYENSSINKKNINEMCLSQNWMPSKLLLKINTPKNGVRLSSVATVFTGSQYTVKNFENRFTERKTDYKILTSSDIKDGIIDWDNLQFIDNDDNKLNKFSIIKNDLIITSKSSKIKMAVVDFLPNQKIIVTGGMIVVRPESKRLNPTYLKIYLESEQGQNVLKSIQKGLTIITINSKDLAEISIPIPSIQYQLEVAKKYNNKLSSLLAFKNEIAKIENDLKNFYDEEVYSKEGE